ncbi:MAG: site-specific DNA-methyltransferase [Anaerolineae bacterium]|nr:site-specific DNA-methyltransferase [Anaerolineae bacterium]
MPLQQLELPTILQISMSHLGVGYRERLRALLSSDLDFHGKSSAYASHNLHAFPAKFPPQLPRKFIEGLTEPGDVVLDPMVGSGTTIVEAFLAGRRGIGFDIDPMALRLCKVKVTPLSLGETAVAGNRVLYCAQKSLQQDVAELRRELNARFGEAEREFIDYWFLPSTQLELMALIREIERVQDPNIREFLELAFSAIIITKSGGVSRARDLAHTRPHRVQDKAPRSALDEYRKRLSKNLESLTTLARGSGVIGVFCGNAQELPLRDQVVDLIVTSPPYAANAIDYMRAHKFSLVWFGHPLGSLSQLRREYIGHDAVTGVEYVVLPDSARQVVSSLARVDPKKAKVLHRYYSEMTRCLSEMVRVLKPGKAAIVVVGSSTMRGLDTRTDVCLGEIGKQVGFELVGIAVRKLDRDKRMMPARRTHSSNRSQIEERMHEEYVIGFLKPESRQERQDDEPGAVAQSVSRGDLSASSGIPGRGAQHRG